MPTSDNLPNNSLPAPAQSASKLDAVMAETLGMSMHNAVSAQYNGQLIPSAGVASAGARTLSTPPSSPPGSVPRPPVPPSALGRAPVASPPLTSAASAPRSSKP